MSIKVEHIQKSFGNFKALNDVSLTIEEGELVALLGPSGSGKTTLLRIIAGLETADSGHVFLNGEHTYEQHVGERQVGFVFQHYALFKHMTVFDNIAFGLRVRKQNRPSDSAIRDKVFALLKLVHLEGLHGRFPAQLSGGQRQRVALARALAVEPRVLLLDEPFGALDAKVRKELRRWMRRLHDEVHITSIFVTHDQEEAMEVADRIVVMCNGSIEQTGTPEEVWNKPQNGFVYDFLGNYNEFDGWKDETDTIHFTEYDVQHLTSLQQTHQPAADWWHRHMKVSNLIHSIIPQLMPDLSKEMEENLGDITRIKEIRGAGSPVRLYCRPHEMIVSKTQLDQECMVATIIHINPAGSLVKLELERRNGALLQAEISQEVVNEHQMKKGDVVFVRPKRTKVFDE